MLTVEPPNRLAQMVLGMTHLFAFVLIIHRRSFLKVERNRQIQKCERFFSLSTISASVPGGDDRGLLASGKVAVVGEGARL